MNAKDKAKELVDKFKPFMYCFVGSEMLTNTFNEIEQIRNAKQCALIAVDEIMKSEPMMPYDGSYYELISDRVDDVIIFWLEVKTEINNL